MERDPAVSASVARRQELLYEKIRGRRRQEMDCVQNFSPGGSAGKGL